MASCSCSFLWKYNTHTEPDDKYQKSNLNVETHLVTLLQKSTNRILSKRCDRAWNWIYLPYGTRRLYKARELPFRWTHHWPYYIFEAQFFFRVLPNTWISMELTNDHFIMFLLSNEVKKLTARFQISNWICKIHGHLFLQYQKKWCTSILLIIIFNQIYSSLFFQCCKLNFPRSHTPNRKSTPKEKNCKIHTALIDRSFIRKRGDIWAEKSVWWTNEWTF